MLLKVQKTRETIMRFLFPRAKLRRSQVIFNLGSLTLALQMGISDIQMDKMPIWRANVINEIWLILNYSKVV